MNKKIATMLLLALLVLSLLQVGTVYAGRSVNVNVPAVNLPATNPSTTKEIKGFSSKIEPEIFKILEGGKVDDIPVVDGIQYLPIYIVANKDITQLLERMPKIMIVGRTEISGVIFYLALIPIEPDSSKVLIKIASLPEVESITRTNPFEPIGKITDPEIKSAKQVEKVSINVPKITRKLDMTKLKKFEVKTLKMPEVMKMRENSPLRQGELGITARDIPSQPADYFAIYHHGSLATWQNLGITGEGINVAVIDSGVDFGNPDLQDAYAVEMNPNSPYYGWPIAYSGHSMIWYLIMNMTFPNYIYSWYADTSIELPYFFVYGNVSVGYKGNFTTVFTSMSLANIQTDSERAAFINETLSWIEITNETKVLLVDDDGNETIDQFYKAALNMLNITYDVYEVLPADADGPNATVLSNYDIVIWFTGGAYNNTLTPADIANLEAYLDSGGKLWMISQDLLEEIPLNSTFVKEYLHIVNVDPDYPVPTIVQTTNGAYRAGSIYYGLYGSLTDAFADFISPDNESQVLAVGYEAVVALRWIDPETNETTEITFIKFPLSENLTVPTKSGIFHFGLHPDLALWADWNGGYIIVADPENATKYDTVYADITPLVIESGNITLDYVDFNEDVGHTKDNPIIQVDFWNSRAKTFGADGYADLSGGMIYFIADGVNPIPYSDVVAERWGLSLEIPKKGDMVTFMIGTSYIGGGDHGTLCAAAVAARGRTFYGLTFGNAPGSKIIAEGSLYSGGSWIDYVFFAVEGYDGTPGTGDEALIVSNSYGASSVIAKGYTWDDRFLYYITHFYTPQVTFFFAAGNGGPGYGTVTSEGASPGVITVGAAVEWGYRGLFGYDNGPWQMLRANYGDVADFSNRGPNALGQVDPDVLAVGEFALGSLPLNEVGDGFWASDLWAGTSLATPMASGIAALVYQAYYTTYGRWPSAEEVKAILMSTAENQNNDVFSQGAGFLNAYKAVQAAMGLNGLIVTPSAWQAGKTSYPAFANIMYPGENSSQLFTVRNMNTTAAKNVTVSAEVFKKIGEVEFDVVGNSWQYYRIDQYIPEGTDLMKVTLYTDYSNFDTNGDYNADAYPWFRIWDVTYVFDNETNQTVPTLNLLQQASKEGDVVSATIGNPLEKFHDEMLIQVRDIKRFYGKTDTYPAKVKIEFFKRVPWEWVVLSNTSLVVPANGSVIFEATLKVPDGAPYGIYEGAIYIDSDTNEITIPVSVVVASPSENFRFGGERVANGLYDNSNVYGYFDWGWRYESGDWRLFYFNVTEECENGTYLITDISWSGLLNDINLHVLGPMLDSWSYNLPDVFGPYTLGEIARSDDGYVTAGIFRWQTTSGTSRELIATPLNKGLHALWLHNVLFDGKAVSATFEGQVGVARVTPYQWVEETPLPSGSREFLFTKSLDIGHISVEAYGLTKPQEYTDQLAPKTDDSDYYYVSVNNSALLDVKLSSRWDELAGVDLDLFVYYYDSESGKYVLVGSSTTPTAKEEVKIKFPKDGTYVVEVNAWSNPAYGQATYNLSILSLEKKGNLFAEIDEVNSDTYRIKASYRLTEDEYKEGGTYIGAIFIGSQYNPLLIEVPVKVTVNPKQIVVHGESVRVREEMTKVIKIDLTTVKLVGALQLRFRYDPAILKIEEITVPDVLKDQVTLESNINNTAGVAEIGLITLAGLGNVTALNIKVFGVNEGNTTIGIEVVDASDVRGMKMSAVGMPIKVEVYHRIKGDANGDDKVTAVDALIYLRFAVGLDISPYELDPVEDDVTGDGKITAVDALKVLRAAIGLEKLD